MIISGIRICAIDLAFNNLAELSKYANSLCVASGRFFYKDHQETVIVFSLSF